MNIGFDLDKIFINHPSYISDKLMERLSKKKKNGTLHYRIPSKTEQLLRLMTHRETFRKPITENLLFLEALRQKTKDHYFLITGRFGFLKKRTEAVVRKYHFEKIFDGMYFNYANQQPHLFKDTIISQLQLDCYVDDDLDLLQYVIQNNPHTQFFWLNKNIEGKMKDNLFAITRLEQILQPNYAHVAEHHYVPA